MVARLTTCVAGLPTVPQNLRGAAHGRGDVRHGACAKASAHLLPTSCLQHLDEHCDVVVPQPEWVLVRVDPRRRVQPQRHSLKLRRVHRRAVVT